jgi:hypothetical protein
MAIHASFMRNEKSGFSEKPGFWNFQTFREIGFGEGCNPIEFSNTILLGYLYKKRHIISSHNEV